MRQKSKQRLTLINSYVVSAVFFLLLGTFCSLLLASSPISAASPETFLRDPLNGTALSGYDAVSYFTETTPRLGSVNFQYDWKGATWNFATQANHDAFVDNPILYAPLFGGHCVMAMARGYHSYGNPLHYLIFNNQLLLFYSIGNREAFVFSPEPSLQRAITVWNSSDINF